MYFNPVIILLMSVWNTSNFHINSDMSIGSKVPEYKYESGLILSTIMFHINLELSLPKQVGGRVLGTNSNLAPRVSYLTTPWIDGAMGR